ncbi:MAG TPA: hypothetical protein VK826_05675 [Bacteroidia bacterium]|nr:hypothetical protein [Bacteroidia bacterium]
MKSHFCILSIATVCFAFSCGQNSNESTEGTDDSAVIDLNKEVVSAENVFIYIPSPIQTAELLKQAGAKYNADLLNNPDNASRYTTTAAMALNMGVYGSDLAFAGIFNQNAETIKFMDCTRKMADGLHVMAAFSDDRKLRLENNINNRDSVLSIITDSYWDCDAMLQENEQTHASALMIAGGWIEGLYLACRVAESTNNNDIRIRIVEQRSSLDKLIILLDKQEHNDVAPVSAQLKELKVIFDKLPKNTDGGLVESKDPQTGISVIEAENPTEPQSLNALEFKQILDKITEIRNGIITRS